MLLMLSQSPFIHGAEVAGRRQAEGAFRTKLTAVAKICDEQQMKREGAITRSWLVARPLQRQVLFTPTARQDSLAPDKTAPAKMRFWYAEFSRLRREFAAKLFALAKTEAEGGRVANACQLLHETLRQDPFHTEALRILGYDRAPRQRIGVRRATRTHSKLGWPRGYWVITSPHFVITTNTSSKRGLELAESLEELHTVWKQLFMRMWANEGALLKRINGGNQPLGPSRKHQVVFFQNRQQYVEHFDRVEPRVRITAGYYSANSATSYFFDGDSSRRSSWFHEVTHQLFQETRGIITGIGESANFWVIEGAAMYMESLERHEGYFTTGGFDSSRLQYARYRKYIQQFYVPLGKLADYGRDSLQKDEDIRRIYTQSAGLAHFLMDYKGGKYRDKFLDYLRLIYQKRDRPQTLSLLLGDLNRIGREYDEFLQVGDADLNTLRPKRSLTKLCLARTSVTNAGMKSLKGCGQLEWLDLSFNAISDIGFANLADALKLDQLSLEGTQIGDESMRLISRFKKLEELDLSRTKITNAGLTHLVGLPKLEILWLSGTQVDDQAIAVLEKLKSLKQLEVDGTRITADGLRHLKSRLPNLGKQ